MQRNGTVRSVVFSEDGTQMALGGYDKSLISLNVELWKVNRELKLQGTVSCVKMSTPAKVPAIHTLNPVLFSPLVQINTISFDPLGRYIAVGCRDKSLTLFDTTTFIPVKKIHTPGWVTSISWGQMDKQRDILAVRSENNVYFHFGSDTDSSDGEATLFSTWYGVGRVMERRWALHCPFPWYFDRSS